jgi:hypothetical protein
MLVFALLAINVAGFALAGTRSEAVDAAAWLVLLILFEVETNRSERLRTHGARLAVRLLRHIAALGVVAAAIGYVLESDTLDAVNSALWIAVVALLESELRWPAFVARNRVIFASIATALYGGLAVLVVLWAGAGAWFDAYDALLWLVAFATIEMNVLKLGARHSHRSTERGIKAPR